jgi:serine/threonine protein phosphatase PrpC
VKAILLGGRDHQDVGGVGEAAADRLAVVISRGGVEKRYDYTDPNEDVVLAATGRYGALVAVADGHWGMRAAEVAVAHLRDTQAENWLDAESRSAESWYQDVLGALIAMNDAILAAHRAPDEKPRTTLAFAFARPREDLLVLASAGDSHLFLVGATDVSEGVPCPRKYFFLGNAPRKASQLAKEVRIEVRSLGDVRALVAVTDGISEHGIGVEDPRAAVQDAVASATTAVERARASVAARALLDTVLAAHVANDAGDNVAVAVAWLDR